MSDQMDPQHPVPANKRGNEYVTSTDQPSATDRPTTANSPGGTMNAQSHPNLTELSELKRQTFELKAGLRQLQSNIHPDIREREQMRAELSGRIAEFRRKVDERIKQIQLHLALEGHENLLTQYQRLRASLGLRPLCSRQ
ncbi:hypothetical protein PGQ11_006100 [Apiospora arundinis]|uniref:Uncharacterized protein n=1 Tax=Apiospora arundinis TaxID=335852 RepID=A0ABR2ISD2_9PEZI